MLGPSTSAVKGSSSRTPRYVRSASRGSSTSSVSRRICSFIIGLTLRRALSKTCIALMLMVTVQAIYAVAGVSMFREARGFAFGSTDTEIFGDTAHTVVTARGFEYGAEYWGTFGRAMWTLFQTFTFESWSEVIARPLVFDELWWRCVAASIFFPSYIFLNSILLLNVLTSITVEAITSASELERSRREADAAERREVVWKEAHLGSARVRAMIVKRVEALQKDEAARRAATEIQRRWRGRKGRHRAKLEARRYYSDAMPKMWAETARKVSGIEENLETLLRLLLPPEPRLERVSMSPRARSCRSSVLSVGAHLPTYNNVIHSGVVDVVVRVRSASGERAVFRRIDRL